MNTTLGILAISTTSIVLLCILAATLILVVVLYFLGKRLEKKQASQQQMLEANKQTMSMLIIDKKKMRIKDANLPQNIMDQVPKMSRRMKAPVVKVKVGPQMMTMFCDEKIFDSIPVKKEVKAVVSGMYIMEVRGAHGKLELPPQKKKNFFKRTIEKLQEKAGAK